MCRDLFARLKIESALISCKESLSLTSYWGIKLEADCLLSKIKDETFEALVLVGGPQNTQTLEHNEVLLDLIARHDALGKWLFVQCSAPARILGHNKLLKGRHYTCSSNLQNTVEDGVFEDLSIVHDKNLVTSKGLGVSLEYALYISALLLDDLKLVQDQASHIYYEGNFLDKVKKF